MNAKTGIFITYFFVIRVSKKSGDENIDSKLELNLLNCRTVKLKAS